MTTTNGSSWPYADYADPAGDTGGPLDHLFPPAGAGHAGSPADPWAEPDYGPVPPKGTVQGTVVPLDGEPGTGREGTPVPSEGTGPEAAQPEGTYRLGELLGTAAFGGPDGILAGMWNPDPAGFRDSWAAIKANPAIVAIQPGPQRAAAITAHAAITFPVKITGKTMVLLGKALQGTGTRIDQAGDSLYLAIPAAILLGVLAIVAWLTL
jgi:hypothetical protein